MNAVILSYGQDTNGQNQRYVEAARKFGREIKAVAIGKDDPAGVVGRYQAAEDRIGGLSIRSVHRTAHYFDWPADIAWTRENEPEIKRLIKEADVVHLNNSHIAATRFRVRTPMLLHHHGSMFRNNPERMRSIARQFRMVQAVSTIDLLRHAPQGELTWLPTAYDVSGLRAFGEANRREPDGKMRVVHCPTDRSKKGTDVLIRAVQELQWDGVPIELVLVEGKTNAEALLEKARADILFDQFTFGYGCNAVEAWALGLPVLSGADEWTTQRMYQEWGSIPFYETNPDWLKDALACLVDHPEYRADWAEIGYKHVLKYHDELPALEKLADLYVEAIAHHDRASYSIPAVTFERTGTGPDLWVHGEQIDFTEGRVTTQDPDVVNRLRYYTKRSRFAVREVA